MKLLLVGMLFSLNAFSSEPLKYRDNIDAASANITTTYATLVTASKRVNHIAVINNTAAAVYICSASLSTSCAAATDFHLASGQGIALDEYPVGEKIFVRSVSGTISSGIISGEMWWSFK